MKNRILFLLALVISSLSHAQTGVIALKSHSGQLSNLSNQEDNFGDPPIDFPQSFHMAPDTITYLGNNCVQITSVFSCDTLCNDNFFKTHNYNPESLKNEMAPGTVFRDFEKRKDESQARPMRSRRSLGKLSWIIAVIGIATFGVVLRKTYSIDNQ